MTDHPTAPVQDDDAEWLRKKAKFARESRLSRSPSDAARFEHIASRLSPTPETGLVEALAEARSALFYIFECSDDEQASRVAKEAFDKADAALSNVLPDEVGAQPLEPPPPAR